MQGGVRTPDLTALLGLAQQPSPRPHFGLSSSQPAPQQQNACVWTNFLLLLSTAASFALEIP